MNITDVGHLTSDADQGEDKMLKGAKREGKTVWEIAEFYTTAFKTDYHKLNLLAPDILCKATDHIKEQIKLIQQLEKNAFTYVTGGNVYFDTSKLKDYGKLARLDLKAETKARTEKDQHKKNHHDFVLWFTKSKFQDQEMKWSSPWGVGYPGWHIECSAMSVKYLGEQFDIHCGGIDHIPIHHTNEIAQSEAAFGKKPWVNYWLHNEFLVLGKGDKMAKSGDNFVTLSTLEQKDFHPLDYRYFCLGTHYRKPLMFSYDALEGAKISRRKLMDKLLEFQDSSHNQNHSHSNSYPDQFNADINDDLNTPKALATLWNMLKDPTLENHQKYLLVLEFDRVLGLNLGKREQEQIPSAVKTLAEERLHARKTKDWTKADHLRDQIASLGYIVGDTAEGYTLTKK